MTRSQQLERHLVTSAQGVLLGDVVESVPTMLATTKATET